MNLNIFRRKIKVDKKALGDAKRWDWVLRIYRVGKPAIEVKETSKECVPPEWLDLLEWFSHPLVSMFGPTLVNPIVPIDPSAPHAGMAGFGGGNDKKEPNNDVFFLNMGRFGCAIQRKDISDIMFKRNVRE